MVGSLHPKLLKYMESQESKSGTSGRGDAGLTSSEIQFPHYEIPGGTRVASKKEAGPLIKMVSKMLPKRIKPKLMGKAKHVFQHKGLEADQKVHIKQKKVRFY